MSEPEQDDFTKKALGVLQPSTTVAPPAPVYDKSVPLVPQAAQAFGLVPPPSIAAPGTLPTDTQAPPTPADDPTLAAAKRIKAASGKPTAPAIPQAVITGNPAENRDTALAGVATARAADPKLQDVEARIAKNQADVEAGIATPDSSLVDEKQRLEAAYNIKEAGIKQNYSFVNPDGSIDLTKVPKGKYGAATLQGLVASEGLRTVDKNNGLFGDITEAQRTINEADKTAADNLAKAEVAKGQQLDQDIERNRLHQQEYQAGIQQLNDKYDKAVQDYAGTHVDPNKFWKDKGTAAVIGIAVFAGLEQAFKARGGVNTPSSVLQTVNAAIDRDIDAQKAEIEKKGKQVDMSSNAIAHFRAQGLDWQSAEAASRALSWQKAGQLTETIKAQNTADTSQARGDQALAQMQMKANEYSQAAKAPYQQALIAAVAAKPVGTGLHGRSQVFNDPKTGPYVINYATGKKEPPTQEDLKSQKALDKDDSGEHATHLSQVTAVDPITGETIQFESQKERDAFLSAAKGEQQGGAALDRVKKTGVAILPGTRADQSADLNTGGYAIASAAHPTEATSEGEIKTIKENLAPSIFSGTAGVDRGREGVRQAYENAKKTGRVIK